VHFLNHGIEIEIRFSFYMNWLIYYFPCLVFRIMQNQTEGSSMQSQAIETIQARLRDAELALRREKDGYRQMQVLTMLMITVRYGLNTWN